MSEAIVIPWQEVSPPSDANGSLIPILETVDSLRGAWEESIAQATEEEFAEARRRSLRRHAIETGIIERLYEVDWGVTEALVAEGITLDVAEREGGIDEEALATIRSQLNALEFLAEAAREGQELTVFFVRQLHEAITRHQITYEARDALGRTFEAPLHHAQWKQQPNHVRRADGSLLEYTPPEQVQSQMDELIRFFGELGHLHPLALSAWLHHRFILIHPFEDGNGRVARALVLLVLLRANYAPLVVDRTRRGDYLNALDAANDGDLAPLIRLFAEFEIVALRSELERPVRAEGSAVDVARAVAGRLVSLSYASDQERAERVASLASDLQARVYTHLDALGDRLRHEFREVDSDAFASVAQAVPPAEESRFWYAQLVRAANALDFYTNLSEGSWWVRLRLVILGQELRYVVAIQKVGRGETGVLAVTAFAEFVPSRSSYDDERPPPTPLFTSRSGDSVTLVQSDDIAQRWDEVQAFIDRTLAASVADFGKALA